MDSKKFPIRKKERKKADRRQRDQFLIFRPSGAPLASPNLETPSTTTPGRQPSTPTVELSLHHTQSIPANSWSSHQEQGTRFNLLSWSCHQKHGNKYNTFSWSYH
uniref:Uncharacterized protein n=1 Tax=Leersia perrieri TaxID=77586 RepID=A0A0D9WFY5_9ORYZ